MIRSFLLSLALAGAGLCLSAPAAAQDMMPNAVSLEPGGFSWASDAGAVGPVRIVVSLPRQLAFVYRGERLIGMSTVSTGKEGYETPVGTFPILQKREKYFSNLYENAPMPFMQRLTWDGVALHAGKIPGRPASHGCVRLPIAFARQLFALTRLGAEVTITDEDPTVETPPTDLLPPETVASEPALSPTPVASIATEGPVRFASVNR